MIPKEFTREGKCLFCEFHIILDKNYVQCFGPSDLSVVLNPTIPAAGDYPNKFLPDTVIGICNGWTLKNYGGKL